MTRRKYNGATVECVHGNIVDQPNFDVVVNAANADLRPGGGVAGAIHRAAGPELEDACRRLAPIEPGQAVITSAYKLPNRYVIHVLGPTFGHDEPADSLLAVCYRNALHVAEQSLVRSIAFPAISTGAFGYPMEPAARIALATVLDEIPRLLRVNHIRFVLFHEADLRLHARILEQIVDENIERHARSVLTLGNR